LVVSKNGPKMHEAKSEPPSPEEIRAWGDKPFPHLYQQGDSRVGFDFIAHDHGTRLSDRSADDMDPVPPLETAIQNQLGLKLEPAKGSVQFLVIDHIEKPSEN
jgi:hypothetical protein